MKMTAGIIGNTEKDNIIPVIEVLKKELSEAGIETLLMENLKPLVSGSSSDFFTAEELGRKSDFIISVGGDGTLLASSVTAYQFNKPIVGLNKGKMGFLAELDTAAIKGFIDDMKKGEFTVEDRIVLEGAVNGNRERVLTAFNDFVIDKGGWPKMIEMSLYIDGDFVTTFAADGLIIATPAGSTGYSLSVGGPIVTPGASVIALSPISAHSLTMRPLIIDANQKIELVVGAHKTNIHIYCDGQRIEEFVPPVNFTVSKSPKSLRLLRSNSFSYFEILRNKLFWGIDFRSMQGKK